MRRPLIAVVIALTAASSALAAPAAPPTLLRLDGIGPLRLGMSREAAVTTGWLAQQTPGCKLGGPPYPITYRLTGQKAPEGVVGTAEFTGNRLRTLSVTAGVRTGAGIVVGKTSATQMVNRYRTAGFTATGRYDETFQGTFITVKRGARQVLGGFAEKGRVTILGIPHVSVCE